MPPLDITQSLQDIVAGKIISRHLSLRNSRKIAALCTPDFVSKLYWLEVDNLLRWIGSLAEPAVGRDLLRKLLATPDAFPHDTLARLVAAPITQPLLIFKGSRTPSSPPADLQNSTNPADAIAQNASAALLGFDASIWGVSPGSFHIDNGEAGRRKMRFRHPEAAKLVESDSVDVLRMLADIRLEPMPVALMLHLGGPKCRRLLLRPETYEGSGLGLGSLVTYAILAMYTDDAVPLLNDMEAENPGFLRTVRDAAGHNLLWYLGFKEHIFIHNSERTGESAQAESRFNRYSLRDLLLKAKCDKNERDVFGISWMDARSILKD